MTQLEIRHVHASQENKDIIYRKYGMGQHVIREYWDLLIRSPKVQRLSFFL